jgi:alpha(1,3/1,4) fucosyltransferase
MKRILINFLGHEGGKLFDPNARDAVLEPFIYLRDRLRERGYELLTADDHPVDGCAGVWFWDALGVDRHTSGLRRIARGLKRRFGNGNAPRPLYSECVRAGLEERIVLFTGEPPVVLPDNWDAAVHRLFPTVFTWNDRYVEGDRFHKFCWPVAASMPTPLSVPFQERKLLVNISGNKFSDHPQELYSARRDTIRYFAAHLPESFDLYGTGWDPPGPGQAPYPSYRGTVPHKWAVFPRYRFGLCYENMRDEPGWITEKIFDCLRGGCVPIYWGASNVEDFIDPRTFVDRRRFASDAELADFLVRMSESEYEEYRRAGTEYLQSQQFARFLPSAFAETVMRALEL